jgi:hypothetical protein
MPGATETGFFERAGMTDTPGPAQSGERRVARKATARDASGEVASVNGPFIEIVGFLWHRIAAVTAMVRPLIFG